uniref:Transposase n=1 Tax=Cacopsylla melanoneura TaxID=428564 RepID=A0A8D8SXY6_9HEMI
MDIKNVRKWCREFAEGRKNVHDEAGRGRPSVSDETVTKVEELLLADRRITVREIAQLIGDVSKTTVDKILTDILKYHKVCARWVPRMFTDDHKKSAWKVLASFCAAIR